MDEKSLHMLSGTTGLEPQHRLHKNIMLSKYFIPQQYSDVGKITKPQYGLGEVRDQISLY